MGITNIALGLSESQGLASYAPIFVVCRSLGRLGQPLLVRLTGEGKPPTFDKARFWDLVCCDHMSLKSTQPQGLMYTWPASPGLEAVGKKGTLSRGELRLVSGGGLLGVARMGKTSGVLLGKKARGWGSGESGRIKKGKWPADLFSHIPPGIFSFPWL